MPHYRKKPVVVEVHRWFKNGDHPEDYANERYGFEGGEVKIWTGEEVRKLGWEGEVVRYFRLPGTDDSQVCTLCSRVMQDHGWVDTLEGGHIVCPGDFIITGIKGERYPCKPDIFEQTYERVEP